MKIHVFIPKPMAATPQFMPIAAKKMGLTKGGLLFEGKQGDIVSFQTIRALSGFFDNMGAPILLVYAQDQRQPFLVTTRDIDFAAFGIGAENPTAKLKKLIMGLCRKSPDVRVDRGTYQFLSDRSPLARVRDIPVFCASLGFALDDDAQNPTMPTANPTPNLPQEPPSPPVPPLKPSSMHCPKCGVEQPVRPDCAHCGIVIQKFLAKRHEKQQMRPPTKVDARPPSREMVEDPSENVARNVTYIEPGKGAERGYRIIAVDSVFRLAFGLLIGNMGQYVGIAFVVMIFAILGSFLLSLILFGSPIFAAILGMLLFLATSIYLTLCVAYFTHAIVEERPCSVGESLQEGARRLVPTMFSRIGNLFLAVLGYFAFVIPGIIFLVRGIFIEIVAATEAPFGQLISTRGQVSHNLTKDYGFSIFATILLAINLSVIIGYAFFFLFFLAGLGNPFGGLVPIMLLLLGWTLGLMGGVFLTIVLYLLFIDLKSIKGDHIYAPQDSVDFLLKLVLAIDAILFVVLIALVTLN